MKLALCLSLTLFCFANCATTGTRQETPPQNSSTKTVEPKQGDLSTKGGTATVREAYPVQKDNPRTTDNERNNRPLGHIGAITLHVHNVSSGNSYPVDADVVKTDDGYELHRLYFVKGGWVDFYTCDLDDDYVGFCDDENGRSWDIEGE